MDITELAIEQIETAEGQVSVVLTANGRAVLGVESLSIGGDEKGSYLDLRMRRFRVGAGIQDDIDSEGTPTPTE